MKPVRSTHSAHACALLAALALATGCLLLAACAQTSVETSRNDQTAAFAHGTAVTAPSQLADADAEKIAAAAMPVIAEEGWWAKDGYVHFGVMIENPNDDLAACAIKLTVHLTDKEGAEISTETFTVPVVGPGETIGFAQQTGTGLVPATATFTLDDKSIQWKAADDYEPAVTIDRFEEEDKLYFRYEVTGDITNHTADDLTDAHLSIILRNDDGKIIAGYHGAAYRIKPDRTKDFLVTLHSAPSHASLEVYAQPEAA